MKLDQVISALQAQKGDGAWQVITGRAGIHYDTLARIARGRHKNPGSQTVERIAKAIQWLKAAKN